MSVTGRTDFVVINDESGRGPPQAVAVGLGERVPLTQGTKLARVGKGRDRRRAPGHPRGEPRG